MTDCLPDKSGSKCYVCGWVWQYSPRPFPRHNCSKASTEYSPRNPSVGVFAGPGTELKRLLARFFIQAKGGCKCDQRAMLMDEQGADWCDQNLETIVGWLREESRGRRLPFVDAAGRMLVRRAIKNARRKSG